MLAVDDRPRLLLTALTNLLVRLQADPLQHLLEMAADQRGALTRIANLARMASYQAWIDAGRESQRFLELVIENNPQRPIEQILRRDDVQQALLIPFEEAAATSKTAITQAWQGGAALGETHARRLLESMGLQAPDVQHPPLVDSLLRDVDANVALNRHRYILAMLTDDPQARLTAIMEDQARRARSSADVAATRAYAQSVEQTFQAAMEESGTHLRKMWVTRFGPGTCRTCARLHGTVRNLGSPFPDDHLAGAPPVYGGVLQGPPRHPNCRCRIVPYTADLGGGDVNPQQMKEYARAWMRGRL